MGVELHQALLKKARGKNPAELGALATQSDGLRRIFHLQPGSRLHNECVALGCEMIRRHGLAATEAVRPALIFTLPGAKKQKWHADADGKGTYSVLFALTKRRFLFRGEHAIRLAPRDMLVFDATTCHAGAGLDADEAPSLALHMYCGRALTAEVSRETFACDADGSSSPRRRRRSSGVTLASRV